MSLKLTSPNTTKGDLIVRNDASPGEDVRLGVGANGRLLAADSTQTTGLRWEDVLVLDLVNSRAGIGTTTPDRQLEIVNATDPQMRLTDTEGSRYADLQHIETGSVGDGLCLLPAANASGYEVVNLFGTSPSSTGTGAFTFLDDGAGTLYMPFDLDRDIQMVVTAGHSINMGVAFASGLTLDSTRVLSYLPFEFLAAFASGAAVGFPLAVKARYTGGSPSAGFGAGISWDLETTGDTYTQASTWEVSWLDVTAASFDSASDFYQKSNNTRYHLLRIDGLNQCLSLDSNAPATPNTLLYGSGAAVFNEQGANVDLRVEGNGDANCLLVDANGGPSTTGAVCIGTTSASGKLNVLQDVRSVSGVLRAGGDLGSGVVGYATYCNVFNTGSGSGATLAKTGGAGEPTGAAQTHWLKIYDGTTVRYIPVWT